MNSWEKDLPSLRSWRTEC